MTKLPTDVKNFTLSFRAVLRLAHLQWLLIAGLSIYILFGYAIDFSPDWEWVVGRFGADRALVVYPTIYSSFVLVPLALAFPVAVGLFERWKSWTKCSIILVVTTTGLLHALLFGFGEMSQRSPGWSGSWILYWPVYSCLGVLLMMAFWSPWIWAATTLLHLLRLLTALRITGTALVCYTLGSLVSMTLVGITFTPNTFVTQICEYCHPIFRFLLRGFVVGVAVGAVGLAPFSMHRAYRQWRANYGPRPARPFIWRRSSSEAEEYWEMW